MAFVVMLALGIGAAQAPDLSGSWELNVKKSNWGKHPKPLGGTIVIEHHEPAFKYSGTIGMQNGAENGEDKQTFVFDGAIDGKEYPVTGSLGGGKMSIRRTSPYITVSELKSADGKLLETAKTTVSADGKRMVRDIKGTGPQGEISWTEVYERR
jgi:hypothetical protein